MARLTRIEEKKALDVVNAHYESFEAFTSSLYRGLVEYGNWIKEKYQHEHKTVRQARTAVIKQNNRLKIRLSQSEFIIGQLVKIIIEQSPNHENKQLERLQNYINYCFGTSYKFIRKRDFDLSTKFVDVKIDVKNI